jgi:hypothetical protein
MRTTTSRNPSPNPVMRPSIIPLKLIGWCIRTSPSHFSELTWFEPFSTLWRLLSVYCCCNAPILLLSSAASQSIVSWNLGAQWQRSQFIIFHYLWLALFSHHSISVSVGIRFEVRLFNSNANNIHWCFLLFWWNSLKLFWWIILGNQYFWSAFEKGVIRLTQISLRSFIFFFILELPFSVRFFFMGWVPSFEWWLFSYILQCFPTLSEFDGYCSFMVHLSTLKWFFWLPWMSSASPIHLCFSITFRSLIAFNATDNK